RYFHTTPPRPAAVTSTTAASSAATAGCRRAHLTARSSPPTGRARIGSPPRQPPGSSASSAAPAYPPAGGLWGHVPRTAPQAARLEAPRRDRFMVTDLKKRVEGCGPLEGRASGEALVQDGAQRVEVGGRPHRLRALRLLRGHVRRCSHDGARLRLALLVEFAG